MLRSYAKSPIVMLYWYRLLVRQPCLQNYNKPQWCRRIEKWHFLSTGAPNRCQFCQLAERLMLSALPIDVRGGCRRLRRHPFILLLKYLCNIAYFFAIGTRNSLLIKHLKPVPQFITNNGKDYE